MVILQVDVFTYALIGITMSMVVVGLWTIPYFDVLLSPIHYPVVAHTPISSRTYFLRETNAGPHLHCFVVGEFKSITGYRWHLAPWRGHSLTLQLLLSFRFTYLLVFMSGFFTIGVMTMFAGYLTKFYTKKGLRNIAQYAQFIFPALFPTMWILFSQLSPRMLPRRFHSG